jgi:hypothetical protein
MRSLLVSAIILCLCGSGFAAGVSFSGTLYGIPLVVPQGARLLRISIAMACLIS